MRVGDSARFCAVQKKSFATKRHFFFYQWQDDLLVPAAKVMALLSSIDRKVQEIRVILAHKQEWPQLQVNLEVELSRPQRTHLALHFD